MDRLDALQQEVVEWADGLVPNRQPKNTVVKVVSETSELLDAVLNGSKDDVEGELGDLIILLTDLAHMYGINLVEAGRLKMFVNRNRSWTNDNGVLRRDR